jgi:hypothetical protein
MADEAPETIDRCEVCGARLTDAELLAVRESGGPVLCSVHALEVLPDSVDEEATGSDAVP